MKSIAILIISTLLSGCGAPSAIYAPSHENLISKTLKPENDLALIYFFRTGESFWSSTRNALPVIVAGEKIGNFWFEQYVYYYAYPHTLLLKSRDGGTGQYNIQAGKIYYFIFEHELTKNNPHWRQLTQNEGIRLLKEYKLSGDFKRVIYKYGEPNTPLVPTERNGQTAINHIEKAFGAESSLTYNDKSKTGTLLFKSAMHERKKAYSMIESICDTKNIAIKSGQTSHVKGSSYITLDELYKDYKYLIKFKCLY